MSEAMELPTLLGHFIQIQWGPYLWERLSSLELKEYFLPEMLQAQKPCREVPFDHLCIHISEMIPNNHVFEAEQVKLFYSFLKE